jgi:hypothetical protein
MDKSYPAATSGSRSKLISGNFKKIFSGPGISHPQKNFTAQVYNAEQKSNTSSHSAIKNSANSGFPDTSNAPGEQFEPRQTATSGDYEPNPAKSIKLSPARQALVDDVRDPNFPLIDFYLHDLDHRALQLPAKRRANQSFHTSVFLLTITLEELFGAMLGSAMLSSLVNSLL